jgi:hypothetical protein
VEVRGVDLSAYAECRPVGEKVTGTHPGGTREVHCPTNRKICVVWNATGGDVTLKTVAGTGIAVGAGTVLILYCDGTDVIQLAGSKA